MRRPTPKRGGTESAAKARMAKEYRNKPAKMESYGGVLYRSRTEAAWAQAFDFMGWSHTYEPELLDGWSPDFVVKMGNGGKLWIEVKPAFDTFWDAVRKKMENCRMDKERDALGFVYSQIQFNQMRIRFGRIGLWDTFDGTHWDWRWWDALLWWAEGPVNKWGLAVPDLSREILLTDDEVEQVGGIVY